MPNEPRKRGRTPGDGPHGPEDAKRRGAPAHEKPAGRKQPYYEGYFGTEEEEGVEREHEAPPSGDAEEPDRS